MEERSPAQSAIADIIVSNDFDLVNKGNIAEMFVGLELLKSASCYEQKQLFYWQREEKNAHAEIGIRHTHFT